MTPPPTGAPEGAGRHAGDPSPYGGVVTRGVALLIDAALLTVISSFVTGGAGLVLSLFTDLDTTDTPAIIGALSSWALLVAGYFVLCWSASGQTLGMRLMGLRVRRAGDDAPPSIPRALIRFLSMSATGPLLISVLVILFQPRRRGLHDLIAGTVVLYTDDPAGALTPDAASGASATTRPRR